MTEREREREHLAEADRHIAECKAHIAEQRKVIETAIQKGHPKEVAESMLHALEVRLRAFEIHRQLILDRLKSESDDQHRQEPDHDLRAKE
jgi:hypothetical protein